MAIRDVLKARGLDDAKIETLVTDRAYASVLEAFVADAESGQTALLNAQKIENDLKKWKTDVVDPHYLKKDMEYAEKDGELAKTRAALQSLKDQGYEISDALLAPKGEPKVEPKGNGPEPGTYVKPDELAQSQRAYMKLMSLSERARDLLGHGLDIEAEYDDFTKSRRPNESLTEYADRKYDLTSKQKAKDEAKAAADRKTIEDAAIEKYKAENPRSENGELSTPAATKFDKFKALPDDKRNSWQTEAGRESSTVARQEKYAKLLVQ